METSENLLFVCVFVDEYLECEFYTFLDLTRNSFGKCNYSPSDRNRTCGPAIPVQRSTRQKTPSPLLNRIEQCFAAHVVHTLSTILNNIVEPESGVTILFNIVDNCEQCWQQNIVQSCFHQHCNNLSVFTCVTSPESSC